MAYVPTLKTQYKEQIVATLIKQFGYTSVMQCPKLEKIVINQGMGQAVADKKLIDVAQAELTQITGQKAVQTRSRKDISNFKLRDRKSTRLNSSHNRESRMPSSA